MPPWRSVVGVLTMAALGRVRSLPRLVERLLVPREGAVSLAVLRVVFSLILLYDIGLTYAHRELLFDPVPFLQPSRFPIGPALLVWLISALLLLVGYKTRYAALLNYLFSVFFIGYAAFRHGFEGHWDVLILHAGWIFFLLPVSRALSVDAYLAARGRGEGGRTEPRVGRIGEVVIICLIASMYLDSCAYKLCSPMYLQGLGLWAPASLPYALHDAHSLPLLDNRPLSIVMGYFALLFELCFVVLACFRRLRTWLVLAGLCFHLTILAFFPIWSFSIMMSALYLALLPSATYERVLRRWLPRLSQKLGLPEAGAEAAGPPAVASERFNPYAWATLGGLAFWLGSWVLILFASPFPSTYLYVPKPLARQLSAVAKNYKSIVYPWTGFSPHAVFVDSHFSGYRSQVRLVYRGPHETMELPIVAEDGTCIGYNTGRVWALWAFRTVAPELALPRAEANLARFVQYWAVEERKDLKAGHVEILARPVDVSLTRWQPHLLERNLLGAWTRIGIAADRAGAVRIEWQAPSEHLKVLGDLEVAGSLN